MVTSLLYSLYTALQVLQEYDVLGGLSKIFTNQKVFSCEHTALHCSIVHSRWRWTDSIMKKCKCRTIIATRNKFYVERSQCLKRHQQVNLSLGEEDKQCEAPQ